MNENYKQNNFILFFLVKVQYIKKENQNKTNIQNKKAKKRNKFFFFVSKIENHF